MQPYPLLFRPVFKERIWGGRRLQAIFPDCPSDRPIGEAWLVSDHPNGQTVIANGACQGQTLGTLMQTAPEWFGHLPGYRFPLLVKLIDAADDLSIQVHPNNEFAWRHERDFGKTECWWVVEADAGSEIVYGHRFATQKDFIQCVETNRWDEYMTRLHPRPGDFYYVPPGKLHALGKGIMVLEIQQSSDVTYRVYDYDRRDASGQPRHLHVRQASEVLSIPDLSASLTRAPVARSGLAGEQLLRCPFFQVDKYEVNDKNVYVSDCPTVISVIQGAGTLELGGHCVSLYKGAQILLPLGASPSIFNGKITFLSTTIPSL